MTLQVAVITGGGGILCSDMARTLGEQGYKVALLDIEKNKMERVLEDIHKLGGEGLAIQSNVMEKETLQEAKDFVLSKYGQVDILINGAGGSHPNATTGPNQSLFELSGESIRHVVDLNFIGTYLSSTVFGEPMANRSQGVIINISSMSAIRPLTKVPAYSAAKAAVSNFTQWLAVHMAQQYSPQIRVNAIAPGFFRTEQNRFLLEEKTGKLTDRGKQIIDHTPSGRFGKPEDLFSTIQWLISPDSSFVSGIVVPVDGGFSAYSGV